MAAVNGSLDDERVDCPEVIDPFVARVVGVAIHWKDELEDVPAEPVFW
jgi:hypothetical protein